MWRWRGVPLYPLDSQSYFYSATLRLGFSMSLGVPGAFTQQSHKAVSPTRFPALLPASSPAPAGLACRCSLGPALTGSVSLPLLPACWQGAPDSPKSRLGLSVPLTSSLVRVLVTARGRQGDELDLFDVSLGICT